MLFKKLTMALFFGVFALGLSACGDNGTGSPDKTESNAISPMEQPTVAESPMEESTSGEGSTSDNAISEPDTTPTEQTAEAPVAAEAKTHTVFAQATSFSPNILFINPGDTVQWQNMTIHDSVSMEGLIPEGAEPWAFKIGQNGAVTLTEEGVYIYLCNPHYPLGMVAAIIVGKPVNIEQVQANATGRSKGLVIKVVKALAAK